MLQMMVDIETLALSTDALVLQVGFCIFDFENVDMRFMANYNMDRNLQENRAIDYSTVAWWAFQHLEARESVFAPSKTHTIGELWDLMEPWAKEVDGVWANSPQFDLAILKSLFGGKTPWNFRQERDFRTMVKQLDPTGAKKPEKTLGHIALVDALWQAKYLKAVMEAA